MTGVVLALRTFMDVSLPYFRSEDKWAGRGLLAGIVAGELALVYLAVLIANWNARFFNALEAAQLGRLLARIDRVLPDRARRRRDHGQQLFLRADACRSAGGAG